MGAWGHRSFENDAAADWVAELEESADLSAVDAALGVVVGADDEYLESPDCCNALAAAEVVAALLGHPAADLPAAVSSWGKGKPHPAPAMVQKTKSAIDFILANSELRDLWAESDDFDHWVTSVNELRVRLG